MKMEPAVQRKVLGLIGLGLRGRLAVVGVQQVRDAALRGKLRYAVVAFDVSKHSLDKIVPLLEARQVKILEGPSAAELGALAGRETTAVIGVVDVQLARGIRAIVEEGPGASADRGSGPGKGSHRRVV